jgi:hypothetical protein
MTGRAKTVFATSRRPPAQRKSPTVKCDGDLARGQNGLPSYMKPPL